MQVYAYKSEYFVSSKQFKSKYHSVKNKFGTLIFASTFAPRNDSRGMISKFQNTE